MGAKDVQITITGKDQATGMFTKLRQESMLAQRAVNGLGGSFSKLKDVVSGSAAVAGGIAGYEGMVLGLSKTIGSAFEFAKNIEVSATGMSGILMSMGQINGKNIEWNDALLISQQIITKMNDEALRTAATSEELIRATQALLAPGLGAGMTIDQITTLTVTGVNAVKSIGLQSYQVVQELRDLVAGGIQPASSTLATALGLKDSDIQKAKQSSEGLFKFLMERLQGFSVSSGEYAKTWRGISEQLQEGITRAGAQGLDPLLSALKTETSSLVGEIVKVDEKTKKISINPELVSSIRSAAETTVSFGREMKSLAITVYEVAQPIGSVLVPSLKFAAEHAKELTIAAAGWLIMKQLSGVYTDVRLAVAGATTAQTFLGQAVINTNLQLAEQSARATVAGVAIRDAALLGKLGYAQLSSAVLATNMVMLNGGTAAVAAGTQTVGAMAVAGTAVKGMMSGVWALIGGWFGVAAAIASAMYALYQYKKEQDKTGYWEESYDSDPVTGMATVRNRKFIRYEDVDRAGANGIGMSKSEVEAYKRELEQKEFEAKMASITGKFSSADKDKGAEKAYEEEQRLRDKIADMIAKMNTKIREDTETTYEANTAKLKDETDNMKRELDKSAIDFAKYGIDVSDVYAKMDEYQKNQIDKFAKEQNRALASLRSDTASINAEITGDYESAAEAQYRSTVLAIQKEAIERKKSSGNTTAVLEWEIAKTKEAEQKKLQAVIDGEAKKHEQRLYHLEYQRNVMGMTSQLFTAEYQRELQAYIDTNTSKLANANLTADERYRIEQNVSSAVEKMHKLEGQNINTAWSEALRRMQSDSYDYAGNIVSMFDEMGGTVSTAMYETISGTGDGMKNLIGDLCNSILKMWANMITQMYIMTPAQSWLSSLLGVKTVSFSGNAFYYDSLSVPAYAAGGLQQGPGTSTSDSILSWLSNGEYVINAAAVQKYGVGLFESLNQMRLPRFSTGGAVGGSGSRVSTMQPKSEINIINNTGVQARATQQSRFSSETSTWVIDIVLDALEYDKGGLKTVVGGLRG